MREVRCRHRDVPSADTATREQQKSFFGDFLPISKKLPAGRRTAEALDPKHKSLDSRLSGKDDRDQKLDSSFRWNDKQTYGVIINVTLNKAPKTPKLK